MKTTTAPADDLILEESSLPASVRRKANKTEAKNAFATLLSRKPATVDVMLTVDPADALIHEGLRAKLYGLRLSSNRLPDDLDKYEAMNAAQDKYDEFMESVSTVVFTFEAIGKEDLDELITAWPATKKQTDDHRTKSGDRKAVLNWNPDEFPPRLFAACCTGAWFSESNVEVGPFTAEQAVELWVEWGQPDLNELVEGALTANQRSSRIESLGND